MKTRPRVALGALFLGVTLALNLKFDSDDSGVYHSDYDDFNWYTTFSDKNFTHGRALSQLTATAVIRLADAPLLPFEFGRLAATVTGYLDEIEKLSNSRTRTDFSAVRLEVARLEQTGSRLERVLNDALAKGTPRNSATLETVNQILYGSERNLTLDPGLPGRPWFRHRIYAPGMYTGYAVKTLPGIREAIELNRGAEAIQQTAEVAQVLHTLSGQLDQAIKLLGGL